MELSDYYDLILSLHTKFPLFAPRITMVFVPAGRHFRLILITLILTVGSNFFKTTIFIAIHERNVILAS